MANTTANVTTGKPKVGGAIYRAPLKTALPTDATTTLNAAFKSLGYCSEDGVSKSTDRSFSSVKAWGGDTVLSMQTDYEETFTFTLIEALNEDVLKTVYGDTNVTTSGDSITITSNSKEIEASSWVCEMVMNGNKACRVVIPNGKITAIGEVNYRDNEAVGYEVTVTALPDENGNTNYTYIA